MMSLCFVTATARGHDGKPSTGQALTLRTDSAHLGSLFIIFLTGF